MLYLLVFSINSANLTPVIIKDCLPYESREEAKIESVVSEVKKSSRCEKSADSVSWTCLNTSAGIITKIVLTKDKDECKKFPNDSVKKLKNIV